MYSMPTAFVFADLSVSEKNPCQAGRAEHDCRPIPKQGTDGTSGESVQAHNQRHHSDGDRTKPGELVPFFIVSPACCRVVRAWSMGSEIEVSHCRPLNMAGHLRPARVMPETPRTKRTGAKFRNLRYETVHCGWKVMSK